MGDRGTSLAYGPVLRPLTAMLCALVLALAACGDDEDGAGSPERSERTQEQTTEAPAEEPAGCREVEQPQPREDGGAKKPSTGLDPDKRYDVVLETSCGDLTIRL